MSHTACLFPGQGAQFVGMGRSVVEQCPATKRLFDEAREILGYDLADLCFNGPAEQLDKTNVSQPALYVCSLAALEMLRQQSPDAVAGFGFAAGLSLGEYTALCFAGTLSFADGLRVVQVRGEAMQAAAEANPSGMVSALMLNAEQVEQVCRDASSAGRLWIANYLCPGNTVLSGEKPACEAAVTAIEQAGGKPVPLTVAGAFHTPLMESACAKLEAALLDVPMQPPRIPVVSNVDAQPHSDPEEIRQLLVRQVVQPVRWEDSMRYLIAQGVTAFSEVGPGKVLKGLLKRIDRKLDCTSVGEA
jgi:[acyl-carrier-protein] S-malonyltransferase